MAGGGVRLPMPHGRGGSVSRRDHNPAAREEPTSQAEPPKKKNQPKRQPLFGRRGLGRRGKTAIAASGG